MIDSWPACANHFSVYLLEQVHLTGDWLTWFAGQNGGVIIKSV